MFTKCWPYHYVTSQCVYVVDTSKVSVRLEKSLKKVQHTVIFFLLPSLIHIVHTPLMRSLHNMDLLLRTTVLLHDCLM